MSLQSTIDSWRTLPDDEVFRYPAGEPGSTISYAFRMESERRLLQAQIRAASAAERYTKLTAWFIGVTAVGSAANVFALLWMMFKS